MVTTERLTCKGIVQGKYVMNKFEKKCIIETPDLMDLNIGDEINLEITKINKQDKIEVVKENENNN